MDSYHVGTYLGHTLGAVRLSGAATYSWHRAEVKRDLHYNDNSANRNYPTIRGAYWSGQ